MDLQPIIIGAPFGNHLRFAGATPTLGTFTVANRGGLLWRLWRCLLTLRYRPEMGGWVNRLGLPKAPAAADRLVVLLVGVPETEEQHLVAVLEVHAEPEHLRLGDQDHRLAAKPRLASLDLLVLALLSLYQGRLVTK